MDVQYMGGEYDYRIVALAVIIAILASYTALDLAGRVTAARRKKAHAWLASGALAMGTGIWSMHFVAMLGFKLPIAMGYDPLISAVSWLMGVGASAVALHAVSRTTLSGQRLLLGALFMAVGIAGMHYAGMLAMRMQPGIDYDPIFVTASLLIAFGASAAALWIAFNLRNVHSLRGAIRKVGAATVMGMAITGMHYTAMLAAQFPLGSLCGAAMGLDATWLALLVGVSAILLLGTTLAVSVLDRRFETQTARIVHSFSKTNAELLHQSLHDPLTNLANRALFHDRVEQSLGRWRRDRVGFAVLYVDLDGFKSINDNHGHQLGDEFLRRAARVMVGAVCQGDMVARLGGDEFVVLTHQPTSRDAVAVVCAKLITAITGICEGGVRLSASIGSAICPEDGEDVSGLITAADVAMYAAKKFGKNGHQPYHARLNTRVSEEFVIQTELRAAIEEGDLVVHYQPKYTAKDQRLIGAEALVRWQHPRKGLIPPDEFIGVAERCGLIAELENRVLASVCAQTRAWLDDGLNVPRIAVNLSAVHIRDEQLPERVQACLERHGVEPRYLLFEITESRAMEDTLLAIRTLNRFNAMGVHFALDDFGTGHSSLSYLKQLPIQELKMDRSFIADLADEHGNHAEIVRAIISLAHALRLRVVAEGVETQEQLDYLDQCGCDEVQGFLLSHPVPAEAFAELIRNHVAIASV